MATTRSTPNASSVSNTRPQVARNRSAHPVDALPIGGPGTRVARNRSAHPVDALPIGGPGTRPRVLSLTDRLEETVENWSRSQYELVTLAAEFADSPEWVVTGSPTAAHWLAIIADTEPCTAREWQRL